MHYNWSVVISATIKGKPNDQVYCQLSISQTRRVKAETHDVTNHCHTSPRQVVATNLLV